MADEFDTTQDEQEGISQQDELYDDVDEQSLEHSKYQIKDEGEEGSYHLSGMFRSWFLDYASYVNLERAIPHINDGLKPVQRRVLYTMRRSDDGRYNKVANITGQAMQFHPHGDASIKEALVTLGQKNLLIDCQGNWGNILTGDGAAAGRYIEARLTKFALEALFNQKTTEWKPSYDGRNKEPISLPVKFPLLLALGTEGIGLGMNSRILPHNFNEICDASIAYLRGENFVLYPDFQTGGMIDVTNYMDGERKGKLVMRSHIEKVDNKTLRITDVPYGVTTTALNKSIVEACEAGKISVKKIDDKTSANVEIVLTLEPKTSSDKTIDALYAFTKCEVSYAPNCCVVDDNRPCFITVSDVLRRSTENTQRLLLRELEIEREELLEQLHFLSLEKIFIEERIYKDKQFENALSVDAALDHIESRLRPFLPELVRDVTRDDLVRLLEIKMARILKFNSDTTDRNIILLKEQLEKVAFNMQHIVDYTINWFCHLKDKYGKSYPRLTEIRKFDSISIVKVVQANEKLYVNKADGFVGYKLKRDEEKEYVCDCSDIDDIIVFFKNGKYKIVKVADRAYVGKNIQYVNVFKKNDHRTVYNAVYRNGKIADYYIKRFSVYGIMRDKDYDLTQGVEGSRLMYFTANPNGEDETIRVMLKATTRRVKNLQFEKSFAEYDVKGRQSKGNRLTRFEISRIDMKQKGVSTLDGIKIYFEQDVLRLNSDGRGQYLGEFEGDDKILVITTSGEFYVTGYDLNIHFDDNIARIEKFEPNKVWSVVMFDDKQKYYYLKRFLFEPAVRPTPYLMIGDQPTSQILITDTPFPRFNVCFGGDDAAREPMEVDAEQFIAVKGYKAKGKRLTAYSVDHIEELPPLRFPEQEEVGEQSEDFQLQSQMSQENDVVQTTMDFDD